MCCRQVQDEQRECRVHGLWCGYLFDDGRRKRGVGMLDLSYKLKFGSVELCRWCLYL